MNLQVVVAAIMDSSPFCSLCHKVRQFEAVLFGRRGWGDLSQVSALGNRIM